MPNDPVHAVIALGSNLGDREGHVRSAVVCLADLPCSTLIAVSTIRETQPEGECPQGPYLNGAVLIDTRLSPRCLLDALFEIEREHGRDRRREQRWGPRTLDLDLILYGDMTCSEPGLVVPHPRMHLRRFVLEPLAEIAPGWLVPGIGMTAGELFMRVTDGSRLRDEGLG